MFSHSLSHFASFSLPFNSLLIFFFIFLLFLLFCQAWLLSRYMVMARRGLLEGTEDRYGLMSRLGTRDMIPMRRKIRHWQKQFKRRHMFWGLMVLVFMCVLTKFVLLNMFSDQLEWEPVIHSNLLEHKPSSSPNIFSVYKIFCYSN